jgi:hypothetical protein
MNIMNTVSKILIFGLIVFFGCHSKRDVEKKILIKGFEELHESFLENIGNDDFVFSINNEKLFTPYEVDSGPKLAVLINNGGCERCYESIIQQLDSICFDKSNIVIITPFKNPREALFFVEEHSNFEHIVNIPGFTFDFDKSTDANYLFMLDKNLKASRVFIPNIRFPKLTSKYVKTNYDKFVEIDNNY